MYVWCWKCPTNPIAQIGVQLDAIVSSNSFRFSFERHKAFTARRALPVIRQPLRASSVLE